jgi:hypothetical protein
MKINFQIICIRETGEDLTIKELATTTKKKGHTGEIIWDDTKPGMEHHSTTTFLNAQYRMETSG